MNISSQTQRRQARIMGILNATPDSFSDGAGDVDTISLINKAQRIISDGADIVDVGGVSTGPNSSSVSVCEELRRVENVVASLAKSHLVSIDTYNSVTADRCLQLGAEIINDVSALRVDPQMANVIASHRASVVLMYSKESAENPHATVVCKEYNDIISDIRSFLEERINFAIKSGIYESNIILDPGMGIFLSSNSKYSWEVIKRFKEIKAAFSSFPLLIGTSRKAFLGGDIRERDPLSQLTALYAYENGADYIRTHNPRMTKQFIGTWDYLTH